MIRGRLKIVIAVILLAAVGEPVSAYELVTHGLLTYEAFGRSVLSDAGLLEKLGVENGKAPFGDEYYDNSSQEEIVRRQERFETQIIEKELKIESSFSIDGWLMAGAIREDDYEGHPSRDPHGENAELRRPLYHFYDPVDPLNRGSALFVECPLNAQNCVKRYAPDLRSAPDWAIGTLDAFTWMNEPESGRRNHFTLFDAREALYRALTGHKKAGAEVATTREERNAYWATTFRALGDVVHLVEDMAQPQHTRNDPHAGLPASLVGGGHKSMYEAYIEARATTARGFGVDGASIAHAEPLNTIIGAGYPIPAFDKYSDYWSTRGTMQGLADYSNRGFFTAGRNLSDPPDVNYYPEPPRDSADASYVVDDMVLALPGNPKSRMLRRAVPDALTGSSTEVRLTVESVWDPHRSTSSLNHYIYDDMAALLLPRAVAYSAGIINYFFRGKLDIEIETSTSSTIALKFSNRTVRDSIYGTDSFGQAGTLIVTYEYEDNTGEKIFGTSTAQVAIGGETEIKPNESSNDSYTFSYDNPIPADAKKLRVRLIFRGKLGNEDDAIAIGMLDVPLSGGFIVTPNYLPADGIAGTRHIYIDETTGAWAVSEQTGLTAGNIDWKGWYENGAPTRVLSWEGPVSRYFVDRVQGWPFTPNIYQDGTLYSVAPCEVEGAALARDAANAEWIMVICHDDVSDLVYRRPNTLNLSPDLYNADTAPQGWQLIASVPLAENLAYKNSAWFFNGSGTEAQTLRFTYETVVLNGIPRSVIVMDRYKLSISGAQVASIENLGGDRGFTAASVIAVDYRDNTETLLRLSAGDWLTVDGNRVFSAEEINAYCYGNLDPGPGGSCFESSTFANSTSLNNGIYAGDYLGDGTPGWVMAHVYYIDLREGVFAYSLSHPNYNYALFSGNYRVRHGTSTMDTGVFTLAQPDTLGDVYAPSGYASYNFMGVYKYGRFFSPGFAPMAQGSWAVDRAHNLFVSEGNSFHTYNYLTAGNPADAVNVTGEALTFLPVYPR